MRIGNSVLAGVWIWALHWYKEKMHGNIDGGPHDDALV